MPIYPLRPVVVEPLPNLLIFGFASDPKVFKGGDRIPLAVPALSSAARIAERFEDILPVVEQPFQADLVWGYWLGYTPWHAYSFDLSSNRLYWQWYWARFSDQTNSGSTVPEPSTFLLMVLGSIAIFRRRQFIRTHAS